MTGRVGHFMQGRRIVFLTILEDLILSLMNLELCFHRYLNEVSGLIIACTRHLLINMNRAHPLLLIKHSVKWFILIHPHIVTQCGWLETGNNGIILFLIHFFQSGLVKIPLVIDHQIGTNLTFSLVLLIHGKVFVFTDALSVFVFHTQSPFKHRHRSLSLFNQGSIVSCLLGGHVNRNMVTLYHGMHLQKECISSYIRSSIDVLRKSYQAITRSPSLFPVLCFTGFQTLNHHIGKFVQCSVNTSRSVLL